MKRILTTLSQKWPEYLIEGIVIIGSILIAIGLENWNEESKEQAIELEILTGCVAELTADLHDIEINFAIHEKTINSIDHVLRVMESDLPYNDSLAFEFGYTMVYALFVHSTSSFEAMKSRGIEIIANKDLRNNIIEVYDAKYNFFQKVETDLVSDVHYGYRHILPFRFKEAYKVDLQSSDFQNPLVPIDFNALKTDTEYIYYLRTLRNKTEFFKDFHYTSLRQSVIDLKESIETEIEIINR